MSITVTFTCGHAQRWHDRDGTPQCGTCQTTRIERVEAPAPTFRGHASGPCVTTLHLGPATAQLATTPLRLKTDQKDEDHGVR